MNLKDGEKVSDATVADLVKDPGLIGSLTRFTTSVIDELLLGWRGR